MFLCCMVFFSINMHNISGLLISLREMYVLYAKRKTKIDGSAGGKEGGGYFIRLIIFGKKRFGFF